MTNRKWMPSEYQDESVPPARATPGAWIVALGDGSPALASGDWCDENTAPGRPLREGETVLFDWCESLGYRDLTFRRGDDGWQWTLDGDEPAVPSGGDLTIAEAGDWETGMPSLQEFVECYSDNSRIEDGETITVLFFAWSTNSVPFILQNGTFLSLDASGAVN